MNFLNAVPQVTKNIMLFIVFSFIFSTFVGIKNPDLLNSLQLFPFGSPLFKPYQIVSHTVLQFGLIHVFFNLLILFWLGSLLERMWGSKRFFIFFFITLFGSALLQTIYQSIEINNTGNFMLQEVGTFGIDGAMFALSIAFAILFPNTELSLFFLPIMVKAKYLIGVYVLLSIYGSFEHYMAGQGFQIVKIAGALIGAGMVLLWKKDRNHFY